MGKPRNVERLKHFFYHSRADWLDGTQRYVSLLKEFVGQGTRVLDVGPGAGKGFQHGNHLRNCHIIGVDSAPEVTENKTLHEAVVGTVEKLPFPDNEFDAVVCNYALEHISNPDSAASEICRVLKPGGVFGFRTPNLGHYVAFLSWITPQWFHNVVANRGKRDRWRVRSLADSISL